MGVPVALFTCELEPALWGCWRKSPVVAGEAHRPSRWRNAGPAVSRRCGACIAGVPLTVPAAAPYPSTFPSPLFLTLSLALAYAAYSYQSYNSHFRCDSSLEIVFSYIEYLPLDDVTVRDLRA